MAVRIAIEAVTSGLISAQTVAAIGGSDNRAHGALVDRLVAAGHLDAAQLPSLERAVAQHAFERPSLALPVRLPPELTIHATEPERWLAEFVLLSPIGRGGSGEVWKAWDTRNERWVALKIGALALDMPSAAARFEREIRAAARLSHPNIVPLFQSGVDRSRPYMVMPLIEGHTLTDTHLAPREAISILKTIALAIDYAHSQGVLHRDLKPGNILIDPKGQPFVLDFGLAFLREEEAKVTRPGDIFGTAAYLAPEQARGDAAPPTPATDVYGLGATLYHAITGRPPFDGPGVGAIAAHVVTDEPLAPHRLIAGIDRRLELVIAHAMKKDPAHRYASAAAFAEDLRRLQTGEPVSVHREVFVTRLLRSGARRPAWAVSIVFALIAVSLLALQARDRRERAAAVESMSEMAQVSLESALRLRRAGDLVGMRLTLPRVLQAYERARSRGAATAEIEHVMGRMYRAMLDDDTALEFQQRALARAPNLAPALYERAILLAGRYGRMADSRLNWRGTEKREGQLPPESLALRQSIVADFKQLQTLSLGQIEAQIVGAYLAFHDGDYARARQTLATIVASEPEREESWLMLGRTLVRLNLQVEAEAAFTEGLAHDRGFVPILLGRCQVRAHLRNSAGAVTDADTVLSLGPGTRHATNAAYLCRGIARMFLAHELMVSGRDPQATYDQSEADFANVLAQPNPDIEAIWARGTLLRYRAMAKLRHGGDGEPYLTAAIAEFDRGLASDARDVDLWIGRGRCKARRGFHLMNQVLTGGTPNVALQDNALAELTRADDDLSRAHALWPREEALKYRAEVRSRRAGLRLVLKDSVGAQKDFESAETDFHAYFAPDRDLQWERLWRATMLRMRGGLRIVNGTSPAADWREAEAELHRAAQPLESIPEFWVERARLHLARAADPHATEPVRQAELTQARKALNRALSIDPRYAEAIAESDRLPKR